MRRLLLYFDELFDLDYRVDGTRLGELVGVMLDDVESRAMPEFGTSGNASEVASESGRFVRFYYRPHLFPGMAVELRLAHQLQFNLLPRDLPEGTPVNIAAVLESYCHLSGDLFGWQRLRDGKLLIWIVDIAGHGVRSGLSSAVLKILVDRAGGRGHVGDFVSAIDLALHHCRRERYSSLFATGFFLVLDVDGSATYCSAGHPPILLRRRNGRLEELESLTRPIGLVPGTVFPCRDLSLQAGDALLLYTDGLVETKSRAGDEFGLDRVRDLFARDFTLPEEMTGSIYRELATRQDLPKLEDDVTFLVARFGAEAGERPRQAGCPDRAERPARLVLRYPRRFGDSPPQ